MIGVKIMQIRTCVPDLGFDRFVLDGDALHSKLNANGRFCSLIKLTLCESREQVGFTDTGVSNENDWARRKTKKKMSDMGRREKFERDSC
jgi:hypothetical protein